MSDLRWILDMTADAVLFLLIVAVALVLSPVVIAARALAALGGRP